MEPKYQIDPKLKSEKDYPPEASSLFDLFNSDPRFAIPIKAQRYNEKLSRYAESQYRREIALIKRTFNEFFLTRARMAKVEKYRYPRRIDLDRSPHENLSRLGREALRTFRQEWIKDFGIRKDPDRLVNECLKRVNTKLRYFYPEVHPESRGKEEIQKYSLAFPTRVRDFLKRKDLGAAQPYWMRLAKAIIGLDPRLVHQCPHCKAIFISKQRKKFDTPACRSKFFSEKAVRTGLGRKRQKQYRDRMKKTSKARKS